MSVKSSLGLVVGVAVIASVGVLSGCGPTPVTRTSTTTERVTTTPTIAPAQSTTTVETIRRP